MDERAAGTHIHEAWAIAEEWLTECPPPFGAPVQGGAVTTSSHPNALSTGERHTTGSELGHHSEGFTVLGGNNTARVSSPNIRFVSAMPARERGE